MLADADETLARLPRRRLVVTDSVPPPDELALDLDITGVGRLLADVIHRLESDRRLDDLEAFH